MAKRYFEFNRILEVPANEPYRFPGLLGLHHIVVKRKSEELIDLVGVDSYGHSKPVTLRVGETLGYNCGEVWVLPNPASIKDPLRRVCREVKYPISKIIFSPLGDMSTYVDDLQGGAIADGYVPFYDGVTYDRFTIKESGRKFLAEKTWKKVGPIDQRTFTSAFIFEEGTSRSDAANVIRDWYHPDAPRPEEVLTFRKGW